MAKWLPCHAILDVCSSALVHLRPAYSQRLGRQRAGRPPCSPPPAPPAPTAAAARPRPSLPRSCCDLDGDGRLTPDELQYFYEEQLHRMECLSQVRRAWYRPANT